MGRKPSLYTEICDAQGRRRKSRSHQADRRWCVRPNNACDVQYCHNRKSDLDQWRNRQCGDSHQRKGGVPRRCIGRVWGHNKLHRHRKQCIRHWRSGGFIQKGRRNAAVRLPDTEQQRYLCRRSLQRPFAELHDFRKYSTNRRGWRRIFLHSHRRNRKQQYNSYKFEVWWWPFSIICNGNAFYLQYNPSEGRRSS